MANSQPIAGRASLSPEVTNGSDWQFVSVAEQIAAVSVRSPQSIAILSGSRQLTFADLIRRASEAAKRFMAVSQTGSGPVVVCTDDSLLMIVCAIAAWKTGRAYLPVSPSGPIERLRLMLSEAQPALVAASKANLAMLPRGDWELLSAEEFAAEEFGSSEDGGAVEQFTSIQADAGAYVVYTSGSTGQPKGVLVTQANLAHLASWYVSAFHVSPGSRASQFAALTFDAAVLEIWTNLAAGATLCVPDRSIPFVPEHLRDYLVNHEVTRCFATTAIAEQLLALRWPEGTKLEYLLTGADTLRVFPAPGLPFRVVNNYGPTECTVLATSGIVPSDHKGRLLPTIGRPIPGAHVYITDSNLVQMLDGERGEICIGGAGVAAGYIGRSDLTEQCFVPDPFSTPPSLMYRTGDIGRKLTNGEFEFLGRLDQQIKLRGYRIEPGEIVSALRTHPAIRAAVVKAVGNEPARQIAAYLILNDDMTVSALRSHLSSRVPEYMIPDYFVPVRELPFTPNGKVDLAALPLPDSSNSLGQYEPGMEPQTEIEEEITAILSALLAGRPVGLQDNFFRLGGHSLLAAQVIARVRSAFGVELSLRTVFESPTAAALSQEVEEKILLHLSTLAPDEWPGSASV